MARISLVRIEGYRSVGSQIEICFPPDQPLVLVGENNASKSNVVKALQLVQTRVHPFVEDRG
jgi:AAA15 family ATPase/GTPase